MKKNKKILMFIVLLVSLLICVFALSLIKNNYKDSLCDKFDYESMLIDINVITQRNFQQIDILEISSYMPIDLLDEYNSIFYVDKEFDEYFAISKKVSAEKEKKLKDFIENEKKRNINIELGGNDTYTYIINSDRKSSTIEGIIRNYIYCEKET